MTVHCLTPSRAEIYHVAPQCDGQTNSTSPYYKVNSCLYGQFQQEADPGAAAASINCFASNASKQIGDIWDIGSVSANTNRILSGRGSKTKDHISISLIHVKRSHLNITHSRYRTSRYACTTKSEFFIYSQT